MMTDFMYMTAPLLLDALPAMTTEEMEKRLLEHFPGAEILVTIPTFLDVARSGAEGTGVGEIYSDAAYRTTASAG